VLKELKPACIMLLLLTVLTGIVYPALVTGIGALFFADLAQGSLVAAGGQLRGSRLIGQPFSEAKYFWGRPSATTPMPYNASSSSGSNLGPLNPALAEAVQARIAALKAASPAQSAPLPVDLVTASASGLDPHISPAAAEWQVGRVARARRLAPAVVRALLAKHTEGRQWGVFGEPRVNVLALNLALDALRH
jgi:potassium-transporting ATPase KdpC subunit